MNFLNTRVLMPVLNIGGQCCLCPIPLGSVDCAELQTGIAEVYYTCPKNVDSVAYEAAASGCEPKAEIKSFGLSGTATENLLQPINFLKLEDDSGAVHEFDDLSENGNVVLNHTFKFKIVSTTPDEEVALNKMLGREVCLVIKYKSGKWRFINYTGGMIAKQKTGNSNQSYTEVTVSGRVNDAPLYISYTDLGVWAAANLVPVALGGLINA